MYVGQSNGSDGLLCERKSRGRQLCVCPYTFVNSVDGK